MKMRWLTRYYATRLPSNPGAAGSPTYPGMKSERILQFHDGKDWQDVPEVRDTDSHTRASYDMRGLHRRVR